MENAIRYAWRQRYGHDEKRRAMEYNRKGEELFNQGNPAAAENFFQKSINADPGFATAYNNLGVVCINTGRPEQAVYYFKKALTLNPSDEITIENVKEALRLLKNPG